MTPTGYYGVVSSRRMLSTVVVRVAEQLASAWLLSRRRATRVRTFHVTLLCNFLQNPPGFVEYTALRMLQGARTKKGPHAGCA